MSPDQIKQMMKQSGVDFDKLPAEQQQIILQSMQTDLRNSNTQSWSKNITDPALINQEGLYMMRIKLNNVDQLKGYLNKLYEIIDSIVGTDVRENAQVAISFSDSMHNSRFATAVGLLFCKKRSESIWILAHETAKMNVIDTNMLNLYTGLLAGSGGPNLALPILKWLNVAEPGNTFTLNNLGFSFEQLLQPDSAYHYFQLAIKTDPENGMAHYNLVCSDSKNISEEKRKEEMKIALKNSFSDEMLREAESMGIQSQFNGINWPFPVSLNAIELYDISQFDFRDRIHKDCCHGKEEDLAHDAYKEFFHDLNEQMENQYGKLGQTINPAPNYLNNKNVSYSNIMSKKIEIFLKSFTSPAEEFSKIYLNELQSFKKFEMTGYEKLAKSLNEINIHCTDNCGGEGETYVCPCPCWKKQTDAEHPLYCDFINSLNNKGEVVSEAYRKWYNMAILSHYYVQFFQGATKSQIDARIRGERPGVAENFYLVGDFHRTVLHEHAEAKCGNPPKKPKFDPPTESENPFCYLPEVNLGLGLVKVDLKCEGLEISGEDGIAWKVKKEIDNKGNWADLELSVGAGVGWKYGAKIGGDNGVGFEADSKIAGYAVFRFDKNMNLKDIGAKTEVKAGSTFGVVKAQAKGEGSYYLNAGVSGKQKTIYEK
jgi:hypothetical protein